MFWVISVYYDLRNNLPKFGPFLLLHSVYMSYLTANLQMLHFIYYSTNIRTEYFKHAAHSAFFFSSKCRSFHNATFFGSCVIHILYTGRAKIKKKFRRQRVNLVCRWVTMNFCFMSGIWMWCRTIGM